MSIYIFFGREHLLDLFLGCGFAYYFTLFLYVSRLLLYLVIKKNLFFNQLCSPSFLLVKSLTRDLETIIQSDISQKEKNKYCILTHVESEKNLVQTILFTKQKQRRRHREQTYGHQSWKGELDELEGWG